MAERAAPVIEREMAQWVELGGGNSGIVGDRNHDSGFHRGARFVPSNDYSRRRDPNGNDGPYVNWDYACAGDFSHKNKEALRKRHRVVLNGLMNGQYPMICEFIGKPWADRPVYYWARWNGIKTLQRYTGVGHDHWSHISWYRSRVDQRANLWTPNDSSTGQPIPTGTPLLRKGSSGGDVRLLQDALDEIGINMPVDGDYGPITVAGVKTLQKQAGLTVDGIYGPNAAKALRKALEDNMTKEEFANMLEYAFTRKDVRNDFVKMLEYALPRADIDMWNEGGNKPYRAGKSMGVTVDNPGRSVAQILQWGGESGWLIHHRVFPLLESILSSVKGDEDTALILSRLDGHAQAFQEQLAEMAETHATRYADLIELVEKRESGQLDAEAVVRQIGERLRAVPPVQTDSE